MFECLDNLKSFLGEIKHILSMILRCFLGKNGKNIWQILEGTKDRWDGSKLTLYITAIIF